MAQKSRNRFYKKRLSFQTFTRDNFTCRLCGDKDNELHAHHLLPWSHVHKTRYDLNNLVTVCKDCHLAKCHAGNYRLLDIDISAKLLEENIKRKHILKNRRAYIKYFAQYDDKYSKLLTLLKKKRVTSFRERRKKREKRLNVSK